MNESATKSREVRRSAAQWHELVAAWERSGLSRRSWCAEQGVSAESLRRWAKRLRRSGEEAPLVELPRGRASSMSEATIHVRITGSGEVELCGPSSEAIIRCLIHAMRDESGVH